MKQAKTKRIVVWNGDHQLVEDLRDATGVGVVHAKRESAEVEAARWRRAADEIKAHVDFLNLVARDNPPLDLQDKREA